MNKLASPLCYFCGNEIPGRISRSIDGEIMCSQCLKVHKMSMCVRCLRWARDEECHKKTYATFCPDCYRDYQKGEASEFDKYFRRNYLDELLEALDRQEAQIVSDMIDNSHETDSDQETTVFSLDDDDSVIKAFEEKWKADLSRKKVKTSSTHKEEEAYPICTEGDFQYQQVSKTTVMIVKYLGTARSSVTIPSKLSKYKVVSIGPLAFLNHSELVTIYTYADFKKIEYRAFCGCDCLQSISIPYSVKTICESAFEGCTSLKKATLWDVTRIESKAFLGCSKLEGSISLSLKHIGSQAFSGCAQLQKLTVYCKVEIGVEAFKDCSTLTDVSLWADATIGARAFYGCINLSQFSKLPQTDKIGPNAFDKCTKLIPILKSNGIVIVQSSEQSSTKISQALFQKQEVLSGKRQLSQADQPIKTRYDVISLLNDDKIIGGYTKQQTQVTIPSRNQTLTENQQKKPTFTWSIVSELISQCKRGENHMANKPSIDDFEEMLRRLIREELEKYFNSHDVQPPSSFRPRSSSLPVEINKSIVPSSQRKKVTVPVGVYSVGEDIPPGKWHISGVKGEDTPYITIGKELSKGDLKGLGYYGNTPKSGANLILESGTYIKIEYGPAVFSQGMSFD